jgi:hypothetical protein
MYYKGRYQGFVPPVNRGVASAVRRSFLPQVQPMGAAGKREKAVPWMPGKRDSAVAVGGLCGLRARRKKGNCGS